MKRGQVVEGRMTVAASNPKVIKLNDNGKRKVMLHFGFDGLVVEVELADPVFLAREITVAEIWVSEG